MLHTGTSLLEDPNARQMFQTLRLLKKQKPVDTWWQLKPHVVHGSNPVMKAYRCLWA